MNHKPIFFYLALCLLQPIFLIGQDKLLDLSNSPKVIAYKYPVRNEKPENILKLTVSKIISGKPLELQQYFNLQELRIEDCTLGTIEINFKDYPLLQSLFISASNYDSLVFKGNGKYFKDLYLYERHHYNFDFFSTINSLENFYVVDTMDLEIVNLVDNLLKLPKLKSIYISDGNLKVLPSSFSKFKKLEWLSFVHMDMEFNLSSCFEIIKDIELVSLDLMFNPFEHLPKNINVLKHVKELHLGSGFLKDLPEEIGELTQLEKLSLSETYVDTLPKSLLKLTRLKQLELMVCGFTRIPELLYEMTWLEVLEIGYLESMPADAELKPLRKKLKKTLVNEGY